MSEPSEDVSSIYHVPSPVLGAREGEVRVHLEAGSNLVGEIQDTVMKNIVIITCLKFSKGRGAGGARGKERKVDLSSQVHFLELRG